VYAYASQLFEGPSKCSRGSVMIIERRLDIHLVKLHVWLLNTIAT
jgi:hypothetical protein